MPAQVNKLTQLLFILFLTVLMQACSGGSSTPSTTSGSSYSISASQGAITFDDFDLDDPSRTQTFEVTYNGKDLFVSYSLEYPLLPYFTIATEIISAEDADEKTARITITADINQGPPLEPGSHKTQLVLSTGATLASQNNASTTIDITLNLSTYFNVTELAFPTLPIGTTNSVSSNINLEAGTNEWTLTTDSLNWLTVDKTSGNSSEVIKVTADPSLLTETGIYSGNLILTETASGIVKEIPVSFDIDIVINTSNLALQSISADQESATATFPVIAGSNEWTITSNKPWLTVDSSTFTGENIGDNAIEVRANPAALTFTGDTGEFTGVLTLTDGTSGHEKTININYTVERTTLTSNFSSIGLYEIGTGSKLEESILIFDNANSNDNSTTNVEWEVTSFPSFIKQPVKDGNKLTISRIDDNSALLNEQYDDQITINSVENGLATPLIIQVSYYQQAAGTNAINIDSVNNSNIKPSDIQAVILDPKRPLIYFALGKNISVINLFTGAEEASIDTDITIEHFAISPTGEYLLASNNGNSNATLKVVKLLLAPSQRTISEINVTDNTKIKTPPKFITRVAGKDIVVSSILEFADESLTTLFYDETKSFPFSVAQQAINNGLSTLTILQTEPNTGSTASQAPTLRSYLLNYTTNTNTLTVNQYASYSAQIYETSAPGYFALSNNALKIYTAQSESEHLSFDINNSQYSEGSPAVLHANTEPTTTLDVKTDKLNNSYFYRVVETSTGDEYRITKYDSSQIELAEAPIPNASGFSFIAADFDRFISVNTGVAEDENDDEWFITSLPKE